MKPISLFIIALLSTFAGFSQEQSLPRNAVYLEIFGSSFFIYNITYDRTVINHDKNHLSLALGAQYFAKGDISDTKRLSFTPQVNYFRGRNRHYLELGAGYFFNFAEDIFGRKEHGTVMRVGYRYQRPQGMFFKAAFTPIFSNAVAGEDYGDYRLYPWGGIAIGYSFQ